MWGIISGQSWIEATAEQRAELRGLAGSSEREEADRARAILLSLDGCQWCGSSHAPNRRRSPETERLSAPSMSPRCAGACADWNRGAARLMRRRPRPVASASANSLIKMVGATGIEPVTPTMST
jgi:hypothetical protein